MSTDDRPKPFRSLKAELAKVKERWPDVKLFWKKPPPPWPVRIKKTISQAAPYAFDVDDLTLKLIIESPKMKDLPVRVEFSPKCPLPEELQIKIQEEIENKWKTVLHKQVESTDSRHWFVERLILWMESSFTDFLRLIPECVETYMGCDTNGATMRRYTIVSPKKDESSEPSEAEETEVELTEEQIARRKMVEERRLAKQREAEHKAACERERKRQQAMRMREMGVEVGRPRIESKKEKQARLAAKKKQGVRMRKTGARATKYAGPGSALEKGLSKKEKKRREREQEN